MKRSSLVIFFISFFLFTVSAQVDLVNISSSEDNAKYVYKGTTNLLFLNNADPYKTYEVKLNGEKIAKVNWDQFMVKEGLEKENNFEIYEDDNLVRTENLIGQRLADPEVRVGKLETYSASVESILESPMFTLTTFDNYKIDRFINKFTMRILDADGNLKKAFDATQGANFTAEQIELISKLKPGDQLEISELWHSDSTRISRKKNTFIVSIL